MIAADEVKGYAAIRSAEYRGAATAESYVQWAQDMLELGFDSPALLRLAIEEPPFFTPNLKRLFDEATEQLQIESISGPQALVLHAQQVARQLVIGAISPRTAGARISRIFRFDLAPRGFGHWADVEEAEWCEYCRMSFVGEGTFEEAVVAEVEKLLGADWRATT